ncbi:MAG: carboxypeptidase-like regulatory domain-containing protein [Ignavibacteria bacterium]|nr:carboxypeptidase-like regulatory domain-containing protein [Ignavibacteria bacterium]
MKFSFLTILTVALFQYYGCNAPHNNPLDPGNPENKLFQIQGTVQTNTNPPTPIAGASVYWKNTNVFMYSSAFGKFTFEHLEPKNGWLYFEKNGYTQDSFFVQWNGSKKIGVIKNLNALPKLDSVIMYSVVKNRGIDTKEYQLIVEADISDDNNIDSVFLVNEELEIRKQLSKISLAHFSGTFSDFDLNLNSFDVIIGRNFLLVAKEIGGTAFVVGSANVKRIIKEEIEILSPKNSEVVTVTPTLRWKRFTPGFAFSYTIEIYTDEIEPIMKWSKTNISGDSIFFNIETSLDTSATNEFFWVIWGIDEFKNKTRSKPASFIVQ